jgi:hypothetical protein
MLEWCLKNEADQYCLFSRDSFILQIPKNDSRLKKLPNSNSGWGEVRHGVPQGSILGLLLFLLYINDLLKIVNDNAEVVIYANDTSIIVTSLNPTYFTNSTNNILQDINKWFTTNLLPLNAEKTQYMQFATKTSSLIDLHVMYTNKELANNFNTKFLRLTLDNTFSWKNHIDTTEFSLFHSHELLSHFYPKNLWGWYTSSIFIPWCPMD